MVGEGGSALLKLSNAASAQVLQFFVDVPGANEAVETNQDVRVRLPVGKLERGRVVRYERFDGGKGGRAGERNKTDKMALIKGMVNELAAAVVPQIITPQINKGRCRSDALVS